jgi:hypothetical protein
MYIAGFAFARRFVNGQLLYERCFLLLEHVPDRWIFRVLQPAAQKHDLLIEFVASWTRHPVLLRLTESQELVSALRSLAGTQPAGDPHSFEPISKILLDQPSPVRICVHPQNQRRSA